MRYIYIYIYHDTLNSFLFFLGDSLWDRNFEGTSPVFVVRELVQGDQDGINVQDVCACRQILLDR